ncbi:MAG: sigma-70 family RNA polymerase sigma factor [Acidobacteria bacterium]|nr:sigma-70 family RNA polymerase sigma factor [Acidobacteriota bacterium]
MSQREASVPSTTLLTEREFQDLYRLHGRALWGYLYRLTNNAADADDLLQDSFCRLLATPLATRDDAQLRAYLFRIASNASIDHWRQAARASRHAANAPDAAVETGDAAALRHDMARTFSELKPQERVLLWLAHVEGTAHGEIAQALGLKAASVPVMLFRARRKLAGLLKKRGLGPA